MSLLCVFCKIKICLPTIPFQRSEKFPYGEFSSFSRRLLSHAVSVYRPVMCKRFDWLQTFQNNKVGIYSLLVITISIARKNQRTMTRGVMNSSSSYLLSIYGACKWDCISICSQHRQACRSSFDGYMVPWAIIILRMRHGVRDLASDVVG